MNTSHTETPKILMQTARWWVVSKPPGWITIPGRGDAPVLSDWVKNQDPSTWIVHRLDRETSGVVLFARSAQDHALANTWFQERKTKKVYHCLAIGVPPSPVLKLNQAIEGAPSLTQVEVKESYPEGFLARVIPRTGRRHQIRIHLSQQGHPIWGDETYQGPVIIPFQNAEFKVPRVMLHASSLELPTGEKFEAPLWSDFENALNFLRKEGTRVGN